MRISRHWSGTAGFGAFVGAFFIPKVGGEPNPELNQNSQNLCGINRNFLTWLLSRLYCIESMYESIHHERDALFNAEGYTT